MTSKQAAQALRRAVIYVRISRDKRRGSLDEGLGVQPQEEQCRALAARLGYLVIAVFCDNDVSADGADWIHPVVREKAPQAEICLDAFHVVKWAGEKLDELRRRIAAGLRAAGRGDEAATLGTGMWALRKDQHKLTPGQRGALAQIAVVNKPLYKGYLIKEQIREAFKAKGEQGKSLMRGVTAWRTAAGSPSSPSSPEPCPGTRPRSRPPSTAARPTAAPKPSTPRSTRSSPGPAASAAPPPSSP